MLAPLTRHALVGAPCRQLSVSAAGPAAAPRPPLASPLARRSRAAGRCAVDVAARAVAERPPSAAKGRAGSGSSAETRSREWAEWLALPLQPGKIRRTVRREVARGSTWVFEQTQGVLEVIVNIRMTVVRLRDGGLFVYAPVAPTEECLALVRELGDVRYIVLPTSAVEHKVFFGPFARKFPAAKLYAVPGQWSFPLNLPLSLLGLFPRKLDGVLCDEGVVGEGPAPWAGELEQAVLATPLGLGPFVEAAFFVKATKTLLVTDIVVAVPRDPPEVCAADPQPLLVRAKPRSLAPDEDNTSESRQRGWWKTVLFALFFQPSAVDFSPLTGFTWNDGWRETFSRLAGPRLFVPPILQIIVLSKRPAAVRTWVSRVASWPFDKIIPAHLQAPIAAGPREFRAAFAFLDRSQPDAAPPASALLRLLPGGGGDEAVPFNAQDSGLLRGINRVLVATGTITEE